MAIVDRTNNVPGVITILPILHVILQKCGYMLSCRCRFGYLTADACPEYTRFPMIPSRAPYREIASIISRFAPQDGEYGTAIGNLFLRRHSSPTQPAHTAQWPCFALVAQGAKSLTLGAEVYDYGLGNYLVVSLDLPVVSRVTEASSEVPHLGLGMAIDTERLSDLLARLNMPRAAPSGRMPGVGVNMAPPPLLDATLRLLRLLDQPEDIPAIAPLIEQEILYHLLRGPNGARLLQIATSGSPSNRVAKAIAWLRANYARPLRIEELAERVGMSVSSLHHNFKAATALTPMQYQKQLRLHEARRLMLVEHLDVGAAGHRVGYQSLSQFGLEYSRLYGRSPLRDLAGLRDLMAAE
jgi:AraC-like DNA-binding protein